VNCFAKPKDSLQTGRVFPEVIKEETTMNVKGMYFIPISLIKDSAIQLMRPQQIDELLSITPGLYIQNYGGFGGMKSVSIRGTSSSQSVMMIDGIRINSSQNGMIDLSTIPASFLQSIEITRTGSSALYGANAIGGAINLRMNKRKQSTASGSIDRSSFDTYSANASVGFQSSDIHTTLGVNAVSSRGNYPFFHNEFGTTSEKRRDNGDFQQFSSIISSTYSPSSTFNITGMFLGTYSERGVPGAVVQGSIEFKNARLREENYFASVSANTLIINDLNNDSKVWFKKNTFQYSDPDATLLGANGLNVQYDATDIGLQSTFTQNFNNNGTLETQIETISNTLLGFSLEDGETIQPKRNTVSISSNYTSSVLEFLSIPFVLFTGLRYDIISDQKNALSPLVSLQMPVSDALKFRSSYSYNYRPPSFNEMYYLNYGNQDLLSERSHSSTIGVDANFFSLLAFSVDLFSIQTTNLIVSVPTSPASWSARNIGNASSSGMEVSSSVSFFSKKIVLTSNAIFQNVIDKTENSLTYNLRIPYTPTMIFSSQLISTFDDFIVGATYLYSGDRFALQGNQIESLLPYFQIVSSFVEYKVRLFPLLLHSRFQIDNLLNESYTVIRNFPVPGRSFRLNLGIQWL
jgi:vitamin B12 transporter